jgi:hypothetical protein
METFHRDLKKGNLIEEKTKINRQKWLEELSSEQKKRMNNINKSSRSKHRFEYKKAVIFHYLGGINLCICNNCNLSYGFFGCCSHEVS